MFVQELFGSALGFDAPRAETYRQVLSDQGWETLEEYAALGCEKLVAYGFLEGHAARFVRRMSTPIQRLQLREHYFGTYHIQRLHGHEMINSEVTQYLQFCKG
jgi:hypothetical protein